MLVSQLRFNWWFDPESAKITLRTPFEKQTIVPLDVAGNVHYTKQEYDRIVAGPDTPITRIFEDLHGPRIADDPDRRSFVWDALSPRRPSSTCPSRRHGAALYGHRRSVWPRLPSFAHAGNPATSILVLDSTSS
jgi:hypothetical protein